MERGRALAQIFPPAADTWLRLTFVIFLLSLGALALGGWSAVHSTYQSQVGWVQDQPVPFSHKHHVGDDGIDCRYCHTAVEDGPHAGLPPTHTCMTCHSQLWTGADVLEPVRRSLASGTPLVWHRVAQLPDYVYFNHSIHVARGVACVECHGQVDRMPLMQRARPFTMNFCLECHRDPAPHLGPIEQVTRMTPLGWSDAEKRAYGEQMMRAHRIEPAELDNCAVCHR